MTKKKIVFKEINKILNLTQQQSRQLLEMLEVLRNIDSQVDHG